ncbi:MAG: hypothetical protein C0594_02145 [Marinilabiliales bacterium]|nr:MAG: hypothetical protein C0594_02145 [Marinilabiliales bacterium]
MIKINLAIVLALMSIQGICQINVSAKDDDFLNLWKESNLAYLHNQIQNNQDTSSSYLKKLYSVEKLIESCSREYFMTDNDTIVGIRLSLLEYLRSNYNYFDINNCFIIEEFLHERHLFYLISDTDGAIKFEKTLGKWNITNIGTIDEGALKILFVYSSPQQNCHETQLSIRHHFIFTSISKGVINSKILVNPCYDDTKSIYSLINLN